MSRRSGLSGLRDLELRRELSLAVRPQPGSIEKIGEGGVITLPLK